MAKALRLGVNIDHVATVRNARGGAAPDPVRAAELALKVGADGITAHLREDRRHILDADMQALTDLCNRLKKPLNFEMAATPFMLDLAVSLAPHAVCLVPEKREERTTEGGLDVVGQAESLRPAIARLVAAGSRVSLFIEPDEAPIRASKDLGAQVVELHTGAYCDAVRDGHLEAAERHMKRLQAGAKLADSLGLEVHAGHGIDYDTVKPIAALPEVVELNIGHFLIGESIFVGLEVAILKMRALMDEVRPA